MAAAREWKLPPGVSFEFDGGKFVNGERIVISGSLVNRSAEPQVVVVFPIGYLGLTAQPAPGVAVKLATDATTRSVTAHVPHAASAESIPNGKHDDARVMALEY
jgi:hypothetical protein